MSKDRNLRSASVTDEIASKAEKVVEKLLESTAFFNKLRSVIAEAVHDEINKVLGRLQDKISSLEDELAAKSNLIEDYKDTLEQYSRANNLRIFGIVEVENEDTNAVVVEFLKFKLKLDINKRDIDISHRLPNKNSGDKRPRPIIVRFVNRFIRNQCFYQKKMLKGTKMIIKEDLTVRRATLLKNAAERFGIKSTWTINGVITTKIDGVLHKIRKLEDIDKLFTQKVANSVVPVS